jgi:type IV pilus assembly protein PilB
MYKPEATMIKKVGLNTSVSLYRGSGCGFCSNTGFNKRIGLFDLYIPGEYADSLPEKDLPAGEMKNAPIQKESPHTLRNDALHKLLGGLTTIEQIIEALHND